MVNPERKPNRLIRERSPYLLQHAHNPVDWYPWGDEAFKEAEKKEKPVFLSIGYSACHWCHVMAEESFDDEQVAAALNEAFIPVKVDREERPDIDDIYMTACQAITGSGGWPLTIIMTPDRKPFFAATYIPKHGRFGRPGLLDLIPRISNYWRTRRKEILETADEITDILSSRHEGGGGEEVDPKILDRCYNDLKATYDREFGGFGSPPKFPMPHSLLFLLRYWHRTGNREALSMVENTLKNMRHGGIYDHLGFGFHRYSTDRRWLVPHFEKMLYDQALLSTVYLELFHATGKLEYGDTAREMLDYVLGDMTSPKGGFYSAEDADSGGEEGRFYVWEESEIDKLLPTEEADICKSFYNIQAKGNYKEESSGMKTGKNLLFTDSSSDSLSKEVPENLEDIRNKMLRERNGRIRPKRDDKILTNWNGLMIGAFAKGGVLLSDKRFIRAAMKAAESIISEIGDNTLALFHAYPEERTIPGYLDDYSFFIWGLIELYEATFHTKYLKMAITLQEHQIEHFWDKEHGGFYFTPDYGEELIIREKEFYDGAIPSGNSVSFLNLLLLARLTGNNRFEELAGELKKSFSKSITRNPSAFTQFLVGLNLILLESNDVVIVGDPDSAQTKDMIDSIRKIYIPNLTVLLRTPGRRGADLDEITGFTRDMDQLEGRTTAYVCRNSTCSRPINDIDEIVGLLTR